MRLSSRFSPFILLLLLLTTPTAQADLLAGQVCDFILHPEYDRPERPEDAYRQLSRVRRAWNQFRRFRFVDLGSRQSLDQSSLPIPTVSVELPARSLPEQISAKLMDVTGVLETQLRQALGVQFSRVPMKEVRQRLHRALYAEAARQLLANR
jgi:hypothetical protein